MIVNPKLKPGDLILTRNSRIPSRLIRYIGECKWSHVSVYMGDGKIAQSTLGGVQITDYEKLLDANPEREFIHLKKPKEFRDKFLAELKAYVGDDYDYLLLFGNVLYRVFGEAVFFLRITDRYRAWTCVEYVATCMRKAGEKFDVDLNMMPPDYFLKYKEGPSA